MKKRLTTTIIATGLVGATALLPGCGGENASAQQQVVKVQKGDIAITVASDGNLALINDRNLTFQTSGIIKEVNAEEGDRVKKGDVLATLDTETIELNISNAALGVRSAELDLEVANDAYEKITYPYTFTTVAFSIPDSLNSINVAQRNIDEIQQKIKDGVNPDDLVILNQQLRDATDALTKARERLGLGTGPDLFTTGRLPISSFWQLRDAQLNVSKAQVALDTANNNLKQANDELPKTVITAPFDGVIAQADVKQGDNLSSVEYSSKVIFYLVDPENLELKGTVDEIDVARVALGQKAEITLDALPDARITGEVTYLAPVSRVEGGVVVYDIKIKIENPDALPLKSGMTAKADIVAEQKTGVLLVPDRAITRSGGNTTVKIASGDKLQDKPVSVGISDGVNTEITGGLNEGDEVIIERKA